MFNFQKNNYKLYNLLEAISLDDIDDNQNNDIQIQSRGKVKDINIFDRFIEQRILTNNDDELSTLEEVLINKINNDINDFYTNRLVVADTHQLILVLQRSIKYFGMKGNYNWINTSNITSMSKLFPNTFGKLVSEFNGDISKWNVSNVVYMLHTFEGCKSLTCDISNWDTHSVKYFTSETYADTNKTFKEICEKIFKRLKNNKQLVIRKL